MWFRWRLSLKKGWLEGRRGEWRELKDPWEPRGRSPGARRGREMWQRPLALLRGGAQGGTRWDGGEVVAWQVTGTPTDPGQESALLEGARLAERGSSKLYPTGPLIKDSPWQWTALWIPLSTTLRLPKIPTSFPFTCEADYSEGLKWLSEVLFSPCFLTAKSWESTASSSGCFCLCWHKLLQGTSTALLKGQNQSLDLLEDLARPPVYSWQDVVVPSCYVLPEESPSLM